MKNAAVETSPEKKSNVFRAIHEIENSIEELTSSLDGLFKRLDPVSNRVPYDDTDKKVRDAHPCELVETLDTLNTRIINQMRRIHHQKDELEI